MDEATDNHEHEHELGRGRCGRVYRHATDAGVVARKRFMGESVSALVNTVLTGAPVAYRWCPEAVEASALRRQVLFPLVRFWFGSEMAVAQARGFRWHAPTQAHELDIDFVHGRNPALRHPFATADQRHEVGDLCNAIFPRLQRHLREAGFPGMLWQAGYGNPVAIGNFMRRLPRSSDAPQADGSGVSGVPGVPGAPAVSETDAGAEPWVWIDLESGVPALFPMNPFKLVGYYLPQTIIRRQPLFDDVDADVLETYLQANDRELRAALDDATVDQLRQDAARLAEVQTQWKAMSRTARSIAYHQSRDRLTSDQADYYNRHPFRWHFWLLAYAITASISRVGQYIGRMVRWIASGGFIAPLRQVLRLIVSPTHRRQFARTYAGRRIDAWRGRRQLTEAQARQLHDVVEHDQTTSTCLSDFAVHLATKPLVKVFNWLVVPGLFLAGVLSPMVAAVLLVIGGAVARTLYTMTRIVTTRLNGQAAPWVALAVGMLPVVGNMAFPVELITRGTGRRDKLAQLLIYDTASHMAHRVPIWGGPDTGIEHFFNRLADRMIHPLGHRHPSRDPSQSASEPELRQTQQEAAD